MNTNHENNKEYIVVLMFTAVIVAGMIAYAHAKDKNGATPLFYAAEGGRVRSHRSRPITDADRSRVFYEKVKVVRKQCMIDVSYPQIENVEHNDSADRFNSMLNLYVKEKIKWFDKLYDKALKKSNTALPGPWYIKIHSEIGINTSEIISVALSGDVFMAETHSQQFFYTFSFELTQGRELQLKDIFRENTDYLEVIAKYCTDSLSQKLLPLETRENYKAALLSSMKNGCSSEIENYRCFYLTPRYLVLIFHPYQVASYSFGPQKVFIPYGALSGILNPDKTQFYRNSDTHASGTALSVIRSPRCHTANGSRPLSTPSRIVSRSGAVPSMVMCPSCTPFK